MPKALGSAPLTCCLSGAVGWLRFSRRPIREVLGFRSLRGRFDYPTLRGTAVELVKEGRGTCSRKFEQLLLSLWCWALMAIGWTIRGAFAKAHLSGLTAEIASQEQLIALLKEQQEHAAKKAEEMRRQIAAIRARPEAKYTLAASLDQAETSATEATAALLEMGTTLAEVVVRTHAR